MGWVPIKCYLCDNDAEQWNYDSCDFLVRPNLPSEKPCECGFYKLNSALTKFRMDEKKKLLTKNNVPLTEAQKKSLIDFVKKNQDPTAYDNVGKWMIDVISEGANVKSCGICMKARGLSEDELMDGIEKTTMNGLVEMCEEADNVIFS